MKNVRCFVRSLPGSDRRNRMKKVMSDLNWEYSFWDNTHFEDDVFEDYVRLGKIKIVEGYMNRVRDVSNTRKKTLCSETIMPGQVANHISMVRLFDHIEKEDYKEDLIFIMEDDLVIKKYAEEVIMKCMKDVSEDMFMVGIGWGWTRNRRLEHMDNPIKRYRASTAVFRYSNPFFITNKKTISYINSNLLQDQIDMPCDVWLHGYTKFTDDKIKRYVIYPALCKDLSYSGDIDSEISVKRTRINSISSKRHKTKKEENDLKRLREQYNSKKDFTKSFWRKRGL